MIGFPMLYWGVLCDESSLYSKSTPIKKGLFIPRWNTLWIFIRNKHFHPLSLFMSDTVAFVGISQMCLCICICSWLLGHCGAYFFLALGFIFYSVCALVHMCLGTCWHVRVHSHVSHGNLAAFLPVAWCLRRVRALYEKRGCEAHCRSQWIHLHSFHCLSLLRAHSNYQQLRSATTLRILSLGKKKTWAAGGAFL